MQIETLEHRQLQLPYRGQTSDQVKIEEKPFTIELEYHKPFSLKTPEGDISETGIREIKSYLISRLLPVPKSDFDWVWQNKRGTLPKRLQSYYYKSFQLKLTPNQVSELGNLGRRHSDDSKEFILDFDREIKWRAGEFGDGGSCYWGSNAPAKDMLRDNGACAIRAFKIREPDYGLTYGNLSGYARAWVSPIDSDKLVVFNGYGLTSLQFARLLALKFNCTYKKIGLTNNGSDGGMLYINCDGVLVGQWSKIEKIERHDFGWEEPDNDKCTCEVCDDEVDSGNIVHALNRRGYRNYVCSDCAYHCEHCDETYTYELEYIDESESSYCENCAITERERIRIENEENEREEATANE